MASSLDRNAIIQRVTDAATALTGAAFGAFFYNVVDAGSGEPTCSTPCRARRGGVRAVPQPRATAIFAPTFRGEGSSGSTT